MSVVTRNWTIRFLEVRSRLSILLHRINTISHYLFLDKHVDNTTHALIDRREGASRPFKVDGGVGQGRKRFFDNKDTNTRNLRAIDYTQTR
jgi:hypothetical protein